MAKSKSIIFSNPKHEGRKDNLQLLRVISTSEFLKVDFGYTTTDYYTRGGWVKISANTFVRDAKTKKKYQFQKSTDIPVAPEQLHFKTTKDWLYFTLFFEPIPQTVKSFDLIESEPGTPNDFNFYNIKLSSPIEIFDL